MPPKPRYYQTIAPPRPTLDWRAMLTQAAFALSLAVVAGRCMLLETIRDPLQVFVNSLPIPLGPGADTSLILDLLCCLPALAVLLRRSLDKNYTIRWNWSLILILPLSAWMALSVRWADDKFACIISAANFLAAMALLWAMSQLVRSWMRLRIVAAVAYGLLLVFLVKGFYYKFEEMPDMLEHQQTLVHQGGFDPNSFSGVQFIQKISELVGFESSPNSFAGLIVLLMTIGVGAAIQRIKDRDDPGWTVAICIFAPLAIWLLVYTKSKAALVMPVLVAIFFLILWKWRGPIARQSKKYFWFTFAAVVLAITAAVGHGLYHRSLPTDSLNFRWRYWTGAWRMFRRHPIAGVGWENFGPHYLRDRLPVASEEIHDPHNFLVRFLVELGAVGGLLLLAFLLRLWWELTRPISPPAPLRPPPKTPKYGQVLFLAAIALAAILTSIFAGIDFNQSISDVSYELMMQLLYLCAMMLGALVIALRSLENPSIDERPAPWLLYGILIALGVFLIHNLIEFSLFETGPLCLFGLLAGSALGIRLPNLPVRNPAISKTAISVLAVSLAFCATFAVKIIFPTIRAESAAHRGDDELRAGHFEKASADFADAVESVPFNAEYAYRAGRALHYSIGANPVPLTDPAQFARADNLRIRILSWYAIAIASDPSYIDPYHWRATFFLQLSDPTRMISDWEKIMQLNPNEVRLRLEYARDLEMFHLLPQARAQLKLVLSYNDQLDKAEPKRLTPQQEQEIQTEIDSLPD